MTSNGLLYEMARAVEIRDPNSPLSIFVSICGVDLELETVAEMHSYETEIVCNIVERMLADLHQRDRYYPRKKRRRNANH